MNEFLDRTSQNNRGEQSSPPKKFDFNSYKKTQ